MKKYIVFGLLAFGISAIAHAQQAQCRMDGNPGCPPNRSCVRNWMGTAPANTDPGTCMTTAEEDAEYDRRENYIRNGGSPPSSINNGSQNNNSNNNTNNSGQGTSQKNSMTCPRMVWVKKPVPATPTHNPVLVAQHTVTPQSYYDIITALTQGNVRNQQSSNNRDARISYHPNSLWNPILRLCGRQQGPSAPAECACLSTAQANPNRCVTYHPKPSAGQSQCEVLPSTVAC